MLNIHGSGRIHLFEINIEKHREYAAISLSTECCTPCWAREHTQKENSDHLSTQITEKQK